jgi:pimeloyl-ACP methyl ester carboxylesterase
MELSFSFYEKNLKVPILVFHDPNDTAVSIEHSRRAAKNIKNLNLIETDTGHGLSIKLLDKYYPKIDKFLKA